MLRHDQGEAFGELFHVGHPNTGTARAVQHQEWRARTATHNADPAAVERLETLSHDQLRPRHEPHFAFGPAVPASAEAANNAERAVESLESPFIGFPLRFRCALIAAVFDTDGIVGQA